MFARNLDPEMGEAGLAGWPGACARKERAVMTGPDRWHRWLVEVRFGGDAAAREKDLTEILYPVRDAVLDRARLTPGQTLLDVGTGMASSRSARWSGWARQGG
jgi:hypothetical protein